MIADEIAFFILVSPDFEVGTTEKARKERHFMTFLTLRWCFVWNVSIFDLGHVLEFSEEFSSRAEELPDHSL